MIGAGTIINPILKIVTTVAILAAVYFFILKPILDTGEEISGNISNSFPSLGGLDEQIRDSIENTQGAEGIDVGTPKSARQAQKLGDCLQAAVGNVEALQRCVDKFAP